MTATRRDFLRKGTLATAAMASTPAWAQTTATPQVTNGAPPVKENDMRSNCANLTEATVFSGHWMAQEKPLALNAALAKWMAVQFPMLWPAP